MFPKFFWHKAIPLQQLKVWVLSPFVETDDEHLKYYYDFTQSIQEYSRAFNELNVAWIWQPVTMNSYKTVIDEIVNEKESGKIFPVVFNICDGDEINGAPGVSVIKYLEEKQLIYTGSDEYFFNITTSKILMKEAFEAADVSTAPWAAITYKRQNLTGMLNRIGIPAIVKPSVSGGSMGVGVKNVVQNETELKEQVKRMFNGYRGWKLDTGGILAEQFIKGPEFTTMIVGSYHHPEKSVVYTPVERTFHESLPEHEKFLSFDRLWEIYEDESPMPNNGNFYEYKKPDDSLIDELKKLSWDAYCSNKGMGYTRVDIRMDQHTKKLYVLEVNAQCGLSEDENYTSIGAILRINEKSFAQLIVEIINDSIERKIKSVKTGSKKRKTPAQFVAVEMNKSL